MGGNIREVIRYLRCLYGVGCTFNVLINSFLAHRIERPFLSFIRSRGRTQGISSMKLRVNLSYIGINKVLELIAPVSDAGLTADLIEFGIREPLHVEYTFLKVEARRYRMLRNKRFSDEEIETPLGYVPRNRIDLSAITWGSFEYKGENITICIIKGDNLF